MAEILEAAMLICFGISWPVSMLRSWKARTAKATSPTFILLILAGYICGICAKVARGSYTWVFAVYWFNLCAVSGNLVVYLRNRRLDRLGGSR